MTNSDNKLEVLDERIEEQFNELKYTVKSIVNNLIMYKEIHTDSLKEFLEDSYENLSEESKRQLIEN